MEWHFKVYDRKKFISIVMPTWFVRLKHTSWIRQLNLYAFKRIQEGPDRGGKFWVGEWIPFFVIASTE